MQKFVVGDGERLRDVKWLTCLVLFALWASRAGGQQVGRIDIWAIATLWRAVHSPQMKRYVWI